MKGKVAQYVTDRIIQKMEEGQVPWRRPWEAGLAINYVTRKPYRGVNQMLLDGGEYLTFSQVQKLNGKVKKGAKGKLIIYYENKTKKSEQKNPDTGEEEEIEKPQRILRYYYVFHIDDVEGIESKLKKTEHRPVEEVEQVIKGYKTCPEITHRDSKRAYYEPLSDYINVPESGLFKDVNGYYSTIFHEMVHSTGHKSRLARFDGNDQFIFGSESYSEEELVAEIGASILCAHTGIFDYTLDNSAAYIQNWINALKKDVGMIITASSRAQKACDYILGITDNGEEAQ